MLDQGTFQGLFQAELFCKKTKLGVQHRGFVFSGVVSLTCLTMFPHKQWQQHKGSMRKHGHNHGKGRRNTTFLFPSERLQQKHCVLIHS